MSTVLTDDATAAGDHRPKRNSTVLVHDLGDAMLLACPTSGRRITIDPVSALLWSWMDGTTAVTALAEEVAATLGGTTEQRASELVDLVHRLESEGLVEGPRGGRIPPRRVFPPLNPSSCLGQRLGLARAVVRQVGTGPGAFRFGSTDAQLVDEVSSIVETIDPEDHPVETYIARLSVGRTRRSQFLFDGLTNTLYAGTDVGRCREALGRTVAARTTGDPNGSWSQGAWLSTDEGLTLVHPAIAHEIAGRFRVGLDDVGISFGPSALLEVLAPDRARIPGDLRQDSPAVEVPIVGVLLPHGADGHARERYAIDLALAWSDSSISTFLEVARDGPIHEVPQGLAEVDLFQVISAVARDQLW